VNDRFLPAGPSSEMPAALAEHLVWEDFEQKEKEDAVKAEDDKKELAEALAMDAQRDPKDLKPKALANPDVLRISLSNKVAGLKSLMDRSLVLQVRPADLPRGRAE